MEPSARQRAGRHNSWPSTAVPKTTSCARHSKPSATRRSRLERRSTGKRQCRARQTSQFLLLAGFALARFALAGLALAQFAALAFHQLAQVIQQLSVAFTQNFYQKRKRQRRRRTGIQQMTQGLPRRLAPQLVAAEAKSVAESSAFLGARQQALLEQTVQCGHYRGVRQFRTSMFDQFTDGGVASRPQPVEQALLQRPKLLRRAAKWRKDPLHPALTQ